MYRLIDAKPSLARHLFFCFIITAEGAHFRFSQGDIREPDDFDIRQFQAKHGFAVENLHWKDYYRGDLSFLTCFVVYFLTLVNSLCCFRFWLKSQKTIGQ